MRGNVHTNPDKTIILCCIALLSVSCAAAQETDRTETVIMQPTAWFEPGDSGKDVTWDMRGLRDTPGKAREEITYRGDSVIVADRRSLRTYLWMGDTLYLTRHETPLLMMDYGQPQLRLPRKYEYKSAAEASFRGQGLFNSCHALAATGTVSVAADGTGSILTDDGDTISNVLRVHSVRTVSTEISSDSVMGEDTECYLEVCETYEWFKGDDTHPVMECTSVVSYRGDTLLYVGKSAFRRVLPGLRDPDETEESASREGNSYLGQAVSHIHYDISVIGKTVIVDIHADTPTRISFLVCDYAGVVYHSGGCMTDDTGRTQISVDCNGLRSGEYVMYFSAGGKVTTRKIRL